MKIGILGAGNIGGNLGQRWAEKGHDICFGVRDPSKVGGLVEKCGGRARADTPAAAAAFGDVVVLAVPGNAALAVAQEAGVSGKILVDATNTLKWDGGPMPAVFPSAAEQLAEATGARVVKAFNTLGAEHILNPAVGGLPADLFFCTSDDEARQKVSALGEEIGFRPVDMGPLRYAGVLEHMAIGWIYLAMVGGRSRNIAFKLMDG